ncbi:hypothetical protein F2P81_013917 [Scophthalmus maximus]|uniref:G-protein coupled receptors family 1 profile domain-containing protein n=1 Tax=Scophthalmus maximus TaxID=52904 RepID=A0A6A4SS47_SCOMX|nr:hypothetical protein F2P81_013917 [Scophthalmus maximus]
MQHKCGGLPTCQTGHTQISVQQNQSKTGKQQREKNHKPNKQVQRYKEESNTRKNTIWAQNQRTVNKAYVVVVLAWVVAITLSIPSMIFRDVGSHLGRTICFNNYTLNQDSHKIVAMSRFIAGFIVPLIIIIICYSVIFLKLRTNRMTKSSKPFKVMSALVAAFFVCWLPYHLFILLELNHQNFDHSILITGLKVGTSMAAANSFLNPVLYVFMGNDFKQKFKSTVLSKMENAMVEEGRTTSRYLSRSSSMDGRASTHI